MADYGLKQAVQGVSVFTTDPTQVSFSTKYNAFKLYEITTQTKTIPGSSDTSYLFNFDFDFPVIWGFAKNTVYDSSKWIAISQWNDATSLNPWAASALLLQQLISGQTDADRLSITAQNNNLASTDLSIALAVFADEILGSDRILTPRADFGFKVAKSGFDVLGKNLNEQIYNSEYGTLTIFDSGRVTVPKSSWYAIPHNLGYVPIFAGFGAGGQALPFTSINFGGDYRVAADSSNLYLFYDNSVDPDTESEFFYYIFTERLADS